MRSNIKHAADIFIFLKFFIFSDKVKTAYHRRKRVSDVVDHTCYEIFFDFCLSFETWHSIDHSLKTF